jgi:subtilisin-like proprotein convertase family protein
MRRSLAFTFALGLASLLGAPSAEAATILFTSTDPVVNIGDFPDPPAQAFLTVSGVAPSEVQSITVSTQLTLSFDSGIQMILTPAPGSGGSPITLIDDLSPTLNGTHADVWNVGNTPALGALVGADLNGSWLLSITDTSDDGGPGTIVGTLDSFSVTIETTPVPEPTSAALLALAAGGLLLTRRRR